MNQQSQSSASAGGALSFGPFYLGGSYSSWQKQGRSESQYHYHYDENGMSVPDMQLIGFKCHINPVSPNPSPDVKEWV
jgi:hypothetical protein